MDADQLRDCETDLYSRLPLLGGRRRRQAVETLAEDGSQEAVRLLAAAVLRSDDEEVQASALDALARLARTDNAAAREALCSLALDHDHVEARHRVVTAGYAPKHPERRAVFYFLTGQWEAFEALDFDNRLLRAGYAAAGEKLRLRIRRQARQAGRVEWVDAVAGGRQGRPLTQMTPEEWQTTLTVLTDDVRWPDLWQLAQEAPPVWSARIVRRLHEHAWSPDDEDQALFEELLGLVDDLELPPLGSLVQCRAVLKGHQAAIRCLALDPDGRRLATGGADHAVRLWSVPEGKPKHTLLGHDGSVRSVVFSPDGRTVASASLDGTVRLWDPFDGSERAKLEGHDGPVTVLAVSPDSEILASSGEDATVRLWRLPDGRPLRTLTGHEEPVNCLAVTPDGTLLLSGGGSWHPDHAPEDGDYGVRVWSLPGGREVRGLPGHRNWVSCLAVSPDGRVLASGGSEVLLWQLPGRKRRNDPDAFRLLNLSNLTGSWANCLVFSPDSMLLASGNMDRSVGFWGIAQGGGGMYLDHERAVRALVFSPDGQVMASASEDHTIRLWDLAERRTFAILRGHDNAVTCLALSSDGQVLVSGSDDGTARLWTSELLRLCRLPVGRVGAREWAWVQDTLRDGPARDAERPALQYLALLLRHRRRADVIIEEGGPRRIAVGEFDVEIDG
jgi:WD40 repeat protein